MRYLLFSLIFTFTPIVHSKGCMFNGNSIAVGESAWVEDPELVKAGAGKDWRGFRVVCRLTVSVNEASESKGGVIKYEEPVLVMTELSEDYHQHIIRREQVALKR